MKGPKGSDYNTYEAQIQARGNQERRLLVGYQRRLEDARGGEYTGDGTEDFWDSDKTDDIADL
jgi:hypothetical protein